MRDDHVFIMAPPRSGTLMLSRALGHCLHTYLVTEHKKKSVIPKEHNRRPDRENWKEAFGLPWFPLEEVEFDADAFSRLNALWSADAGDRRLIIKNPNNVVRAREIRRAFPKAQFVWLVRNPWAVIQSMLGGKRVGRKKPMFLGASEVLQHEDPVLRAAASWVYALDMMQEIESSADIQTRYENLVANPQQELDRIARDLSLTGTERAKEVPESRAEDFRIANYVLRRSPAWEQILQIIAPAASKLGYPEIPPGFPGDNDDVVDRGPVLRYLMRWLGRG